MKQLFCVEHQEWFDEDFFMLRVGGKHASPRRSRRCKYCEQTRRDELKEVNRWLQKAKNTLNRHATKYIALGLASSRAEFCQKFGWNIAEIAHDMEHA